LNQATEVGGQFVQPFSGLVYTIYQTEMIGIQSHCYQNTGRRTVLFWRATK